MTSTTSVSGQAISPTLPISDTQEVANGPQGDEDARRSDDEAAAAHEDEDQSREAQVPLDEAEDVLLPGLEEGQQRLHVGDGAHLKHRVGRAAGAGAGLRQRCCGVDCRDADHVFVCAWQ